MKLKQEFIAHVTDDESLLVPTGAAKFSGIIRGNRTLGAILELLQSETSEEELIQALSKRFEAPREVIARDVKKALSNLRSVGALCE